MEGGGCLLLISIALLWAGNNPERGEEGEKSGKDITMMGSSSAVEWVLSMFQALGLIHSTKKKKRKRKDVILKEATASVNPFIVSSQNPGR